MSDRDYYEILGLTPRADGTMVDQAYWHLARKYQSLAATNPRAIHMLDQLNEAYGVLGNPRLREQYDAFRDDVLIRKGMIQPVRATAPAPRPKAERTSRWRLPSLTVEHWRTYGVSLAIVVLAFAGLWQGVNLAFVSITLAGGLTLALVPTVTRRVAEFDLHMPSMTMPSIQAPRLSIPNISDVVTPGMRDLGLGQRDELMDADMLRASTAATIARWRQSVGLRPSVAPDAPAPDSTLVEIVEQERGLSDGDEPFVAVMEILRRGAQHQTTESKS